MGYSTDFCGKFLLDRPADADLEKILHGLNNTRRMKRNVGPEYGVEGEFYFDGNGFMGQDHDATVVDNNSPPSSQPGLWCQWRLSEDKKAIEWDKGEKFDEYVAWIQYIIARVLKPRGYALNGMVEYEGEDYDDRGLIVINDNKVRVIGLFEPSDKPWLEELLHRSEDPNELYLTGSQPLHYICWLNGPGVAPIEALLVHGADPNVKNGFGYTPLHIACLCGNAVAAKALLDAGANVDLSGINYCPSPLYEACMNGEADIVRLLLTHGADPYIKNLWGESALDRMMEQRDTAPGEWDEFEKILKEYYPQFFLDKIIGFEEGDPDREELLTWFQENHPELYFSKFCTAPIPGAR